MAQPASAPATGAFGQGAVQVRQMWPDLLEAVKNRRRFTWILLSQNAQVVGFDGTTLQLGFSNAGARDSFVNGGSEDVLRQALSDSLGVQWKIESIVDPSGGAGSPASQGGRPASGPGPSSGLNAGPPAVPTRPAPQPGPPASPAARPSAGSGSSSGSGSGSGSAPAPGPAPAASAEPKPRPRREPGPPPVAPEDDLPAEDDPDLDDTALGGHDLIVRELGATVIEEFTDE